MASYWDWVPALITAGATIYGANAASKARSRATQQANLANQRATQTIVDSNKQATDAYVQASKSAENIMREQQYAASPGLVSIQNVIGRGEELTPLQKQSLEDARRRTLDTLRGGSLRGSARATSATIRDVESRMKNQYIDMNRNRADRAAANLSGQYFNAGNNVANLNLGRGNAVSSGLLNSGRAAGAGIDTIGQNNAIDTINRATTRGTAIGDISAIIADQIKERNKERPSEGE